MRETRRGREAALLLRQRNAKSLSHRPPSAPHWDGRRFLFRTVRHRLHVLPLAVKETAKFLPNQGLTVRSSLRASASTQRLLLHQRDNRILVFSESRLNGTGRRGNPRH